MNSEYKNSRIAIIDFCGTLVRLQTADRFVFMLVKKNPIKLFMFCFLYFYQKISLITKINLLRLKLDKSIYLGLIKNYSMRKINKTAEKYSKHLYNKYLNEEVVEIIKSDRYQKRIIVSAGYFEYINFFAKLLPVKIDKVYASNFIYINDKFTGQIDRTVYSFDKIKLLDEKEKIFGIDKNNITVLTDSISDLPLTEIASEVICVSPDDKLKKYALNKEWTII